MDALIKANPNFRLLSKTKLYEAARKADPSIKRKTFDDWYASNKTPTNELFASPPPTRRKKFAKIAFPPDSFQIDVVFMNRYKAANRGLTAFLLLVEVNSRRAFAYVLKDTKMETILASYRKFLQDVQDKPHFVKGDDEFSARKFVAANDAKDITVITGTAKDEHVTQGDPLGIIDSLVRTLRRLIEKRIAADDDPKWTSWLGEIVDTYNATPHGSLGKGKVASEAGRGHSPWGQHPPAADAPAPQRGAQANAYPTPDEVYEDHSAKHKIWAAGAAHNMALSKDVAEKFKAGDYVRVRLAKPQFTKGTTQTMSLQVYQVTGVTGTRVAVKTYPEGVQQARAYKPNELLKVDKPATLEAPKRAEAVRAKSTAARKLAKEGVAPVAKPPAARTRSAARGPTTRSRAARPRP
jgi:hypothetical protein